MKKIISLLLVFSLIVPICATANDEYTISGDNSECFSIYSAEGDEIIVVTNRTDDAAIAKVYMDGVLKQCSVANANTLQITTECYGQTETTNTNARQNTGEIGEFKTIVTHLPISGETIARDVEIRAVRDINDEPVDNTGLSSAYFDSNYYFLGSHGNTYAAPNVYGYLFRTYTSTYDGETHHWSWGAGDTIGAISAYISLLGGPVSAIVSLLIFTGGLVLAYNQSVMLATYTFHYDYQVRVYGDIHFTTYRNITYWRIDNVTEGTTKWDRKKFNFGFTMANSEMVNAALANYIRGQQ